jgi:ubiquinone/menaquinone biosynthesis C-methylase UbiE
VRKTSSNEQLPDRRDRVVKSLWRLLAKLWYPVLTRLTRHSSISFLNYGYSSDGSAAALPTLRLEDEADRICIQLYDHVARSAGLNGRKVLEVSCGHGGGASYLARYLGPSAVHAIDRNPHAIRLCKRRHKVPGLTFSCGNAMSLNFAKNTFDAVVNVEASHCYPDLPHFLREVLRVLRPGGYFLYADFRQTDPDHAALHRQVIQSDLEFISQENISRDVVRGMQLNSDRNLQLIRRLVPFPLRKAAMSFAGLKGSSIYQALQSGKTIYFLYVLRKPMAATSS